MLPESCFLSALTGESGFVRPGSREYKTFPRGKRERSYRGASSVHHAEGVRRLGKLAVNETRVAKKGSRSFLSFGKESKSKGLLIQSSLPKKRSRSKRGLSVAEERLICERKPRVPGSEGRGEIFLVEGLYCFVDGEASPPGSGGLKGILLRKGADRGVREVGKKRQELLPTISRNENERARSRGCARKGRSR